MEVKKKQKALKIQKGQWEIELGLSCTEAWRIGGKVNYMDNVMDMEGMQEHEEGGVLESGKSKLQR